MHPISQNRHHQVYPGRATRFRPGFGLVLSLYIAHRSHCGCSWPHATAVCSMSLSPISIETLLSPSWRGAWTNYIFGFCWNGLSLNPDKTDAILLGTCMRSKTISTLNIINVAGTPVALSDSIKILGVVLDKNLTFDFHISHVSKSSFYHIRALRHIRPALTDDVAKMVACSFLCY